MMDIIYVTIGQGVVWVLAGAMTLNLLAGLFLKISGEI